MAGGGVFATRTGTGESGTAAVHTHCVCGKDAGVSVNGHTHSEAVTFTAWDKTDSLPTETGNYYLTENVTVDGVWKPADGTVLCLNGKTISMNAAGDAISVGKGTTFILTDCKEVQGSITHGVNLETKYTGRGMNVAGTFTMYGGNITGNNKEVANYTLGGGGVYVATDATFTMNGGSVAENIIISKNTYPNGGGVYVAGEFVINGGNIIKNEAKFGGGVYVGANAHLRMNGGNITENIAKVNAPNGSGYGGGVYVVRTDAGEEGTLTMSGGNITGNTAIGADANSGGVYSKGSLSISGDVKITGNLRKSQEDTAGIADNLHLITYFKFIEINGEIKETANIGVTTVTVPTTDNPVAITKEYNTNYSDNFHSDNKQYKSYYDDSDQKLKLKLLTSQSEFKFENDTETKTYGDVNFTKKAVGQNDNSTVTYSSSDESVATVNETTGAVTITGAGTAVITATASETDDYKEATASYNLIVNKRTPIVSEFTFISPVNLTYDGNPKTAQVALNSKYTGCGDITVKYYNKAGTATEAINTGTYVIKFAIAEGKNFNATDTELTSEDFTFTVVAKELTADMIANIPAQTYTVSAIKPEVAVTDGSGTLVKGTDYEVTYTGNTNVGTGSVKVTGKGNYSGEIIKNFVINKANPSYNVPEERTAKYGDKLSAVTLPDGWSWMNPDDTVGNVTAYGSSNTHKAKYTPADTDNYNVIENIEVPVKVSAKKEVDVIAPEIRVLAGEKREVDLSSYKKNSADVMGGAYADSKLIFENNGLPYKVQDKDMVGFTVKSDATAGESDIITVGVDSADGNTYYDIKFKVTVRSKSSGGTYKPPVQKPSIITAGEGFKAELSSDGTKATITVEEGYEIVDVLVNGISKGKVTEITGLKTGDTIEVKTEKKQTEPVKPADNKHIIRGVKNTEIELEITVNKDGNIVIKWKKSKGYRVDSFEILRAVKKNGKYSKIYTTKSGKASRIINAKNLKDGKRYYYKVRGVRTIDGKKYYTEWSDIESKKVKK